MRIESEAIGYVRAPRPHAEDDFWGGEQARATLATTSMAGGGHLRSARQEPAESSTICTLVRVEGRTLVVQELDAIDGTPILDIKP